MIILSPKSQSFDKKSIGDEVVFSKTHPGTGTRIHLERLRNRHGREILALSG